MHIKKCIGYIHNVNRTHAPAVSISHRPLTTILSYWLLIPEGSDVRSSNWQIFLLFYTTSSYCCCFILFKNWNQSWFTTLLLFYQEYTQTNASLLFLLMLILHWQHYMVERLRWFLVVFDGKCPNERWNDHLISATSQCFLRTWHGKIYCFKILACFVYHVCGYPFFTPAPSTLFSSTPTPHFCLLFHSIVTLESSHSLLFSVSGHKSLQHTV